MGTAPTSGRSDRRRIIYAIAAGLLLLLVGVLASVIAASSHDPKPPAVIVTPEETWTASEQAHLDDLREHGINVTRDHEAQFVDLAHSTCEDIADASAPQAYVNTLLTTGTDATTYAVTSAITHLCPTFLYLTWE